MNVPWGLSNAQHECQEAAQLKLACNKCHTRCVPAAEADFDVFSMRTRSIHARCTETLLEDLHITTMLCMEAVPAHLQLTAPTLRT